MAEQKIVEKARKILVDELGYPDPADCGGYDGNGLVMYAQDDYKKNMELENLLKYASKCYSSEARDKLWTASADYGRPEFVIVNNQSNLAIVIECKPEKKTSLLISPILRDKKMLPVRGDIIGKYAADGAVHYARFLSKEYDVIAIGISGIPNEDALNIKTFFWKRNQSLQFTEEGESKLCYGPFYDLKLDRLFPYEYYVSFVKNETGHIIKEFNEEKAALAATELNIMLDASSVNPLVRALLISGLLLALRDKTFQTTYDNRDIPVSEIQTNLKNAIMRVINSSDIDDEYKKQVLRDKFTDTFNQQELLENNADKLRQVLKKLHETIYPCLNGDYDIDIIGKFYHEFLRYAKNGANNGIKLTPSFITDLFCELAELEVADTVLDPCLGTSGFLIAAMNHLYLLAEEMTQEEIDAFFDKVITEGKLEAKEIRLMKNHNKAYYGSECFTVKDVKEYIRKHQLVGCESDPTMYALGCTNMILRGDGKSNILHGDCMKLQDKIRNFHATVGMMNPPYSETAYNILDFVYMLCGAVQRGKRTVVIVPTSCAHSDDYLELRNRILKENTLLGVMSMNLELFKGIAGTIACIMVFKSGIPHDFSKAVYFGNWKEDGFIWHKTLGRIPDKEHVMYSMLPGEYRERWLKSFGSEGVDDSYGIWRKLTREASGECRDEWLWEYFVETDYTLLTQADFEEVVKEYMIYSFRQLTLEEVDE